MQYIRLLLFYSVIFKSVIFLSVIFQSVISSPATSSPVNSAIPFAKGEEDAQALMDDLRLLTSRSVDRQN